VLSNETNSNGMAVVAEETVYDTVVACRVGDIEVAVVS
jgi:hypothetical protein